jgi:transcriptional regulator with GAF, ATPase, and Fis domain
MGNLAGTSVGPGGLVGQSSAMAAVRHLVQKAARNRLPVLLLGETGTGKEVAARAIYQANPTGQFVPIDCGSLVGSLMESELFGHVRGAFSGAAETKKGLVELADGGTAFFDEIGDLPLEMQVKLLRLIQEREFRPVGSVQWRKVDLRIIAATHRDLKAEVAAGHFRLDLYYRLNVFPIHIPALRDRKEDIPLLVEAFAGEASQIVGPEILRLFASYDWPGNVRELRHSVERMSALRTEGALRMADAPSALQLHMAAGLERLAEEVSIKHQPAQFLPEFVHAPSPVISPPPRDAARPAYRGAATRPLKDTERQAIVAALAATGGERGKTARLLEISRTTLYRRMREYGLT